MHTQREAKRCQSTLCANSNMGAHANVVRTHMRRVYRSTRTLLLFHAFLLSKRTLETRDL